MSATGVKCDYLDGDICKVASAMVSADITTYPSTCEACSKQAQPFSINQFTCGLANLYVLQNKLNRADYPAVADCFDSHAQLGNGPGTELKKLISWLPIPGAKKKCGRCGNLELKMNKWGCDVCGSEKRGYIIRKLMISAKKNNIPTTEFLLGVLLNKAISNARREVR